MRSAAVQNGRATDLQNHCPCCCFLTILQGRSRSYDLRKLGICLGVGPCILQTWLTISSPHMLINVGFFPSFRLFSICLAMHLDQLHPGLPESACLMLEGMTFFWSSGQMCR